MSKKYQVRTVLVIEDEANIRNFASRVLEPISVYHSVCLGADDDVRKPFRTRELLARIKNKLRRARSALCQTDY